MGTGAAVINREVLCRAAPFLTYLLFIALYDGLTKMGWSDAQLHWIYPLKIVVVAVLLLYWRKFYSELLPSRRQAAMSLVAVMVGIAVFVAWISLGADWMTLGKATAFAGQSVDGGINWALVAVRWSGAALIVPVMEELFWRSLVLRWLKNAQFLAVDPQRIGLRAFSITAVLFGFEHHLWLAGLLAGAAYNLLYMRSRSLWWPVLAHGVTNGLLGLWVISTRHWEYW